MEWVMSTFRYASRADAGSKEVLPHVKATRKQKNTDRAQPVSDLPALPVARVHIAVRRGRSRGLASCHYPGARATASIDDGRVKLFPPFTVKQREKDEVFAFVTKSSRKTCKGRLRCKDGPTPALSLQCMKCMTGREKMEKTKGIAKMERTK